MDIAERHTCWGAPCSQPGVAVALLRAHASRAGLELSVVSPANAAAAVIAAEAWWTAVGATSFAHPRRHGDAALTAFAAIVEHAAGHDPVSAHTHVLVEHGRPAPDAWFVKVADWTAWLDANQLERSTFTAAAELLAVGADDPRLATMTSVLLAAADTA